MSKENILKIEQISPQLYGPNCDPQIINFCQEVQNYYLSNPDKFNELFQFLITTKVPHFKFWLFDTLIQLISQKYANMSNETKNNFRQELLNMFNSNFDTIFNESFVTNRFCLLFNKFIFFDFPENNNTIFDYILNNIFSTQDDFQKLKKLDLILNIFDVFNEEYIQFRHTYNELQINRTNIIKDYMRINTIPNILIVIKAILEMEEIINNEKIVQKSIVIVSQFIHWVNFEFFYDVLNIILGNLIKKYQYFKPCCDILFMIVKKGMDPPLKINILNTIKINDLINNILTNNKKIDYNTLERISDIIDQIGNFIIENLEYTKKLIKNNNNNATNEIIEIFNWSCNELRYYFYFLKEIITYNNQINYKEGSALCKSLDVIVLYLKQNDIILQRNNYVMDSLKEIINVIEKIMRIPENEFTFDEDLSELKNDEEFFKLRNDLSNIYKNIYNINILKEYIIDSLLNNLTFLLKINNEQNINAININSLNKYDIEFCLHLINTVQENFKSNDLKDNSGLSQKIQKIYKILISYPFPNIKKADFILLSYYDTINRGIEYIINETKVVEYMIKLYISEQGIFYNGEEFYKNKIINFFDKFLSKIKKNISKIDLNLDLNTFVNSINGYIYKLINYIKTSKDYKILEKYILLFHLYGIIISIDKNNDNKKNNYKNALKLFITIINDLNVNNTQLNEYICELILGCLIQFIQSVGMKIENVELKKLFLEFFDYFIENYCSKIINNKNNKLITKFISLLQRILSLLGIDSLKYLEYFFKNSGYLNQNIIIESLKLLQNSINLLKNNTKILVKKTFNVFFKYISGLDFPKNNISDENKTLINIFAEFIKTFNCVTSYICEVIFENNGIDNLNYLKLIKFVLNLGSYFYESMQRRSSIRSIKNLCKYFNTNKNTFLNFPEFDKLINLILTGLFNIYNKSTKKDAIDISTSIDIAECHLYFVDFGNIYTNYLIKYLTQNEINEFINIIKNTNYKIVKPNNNLLIALEHIIKKIVCSIK